ncbi:guanine nucleotide exchange protein for ADP-robosylation factor [Diplodia seriata]
MADSEPPRDDQDTKSDEHREEEQAPHPAQSEDDQPAEEDAPAQADAEPAEPAEPAPAPEKVEEESEKKELEDTEHAAPAEASAPAPETAEDGSREDEPQSPRTGQPAPPRISLPEGSSEHSDQQDRPPTDSSDHTVPPSPSVRLRTDSQSTAATNATAKTTTRSSLVFVVTALETIAASKDARKTKKLADTTQKALSAIKGDGDPSSIDPEVLFEPLQLATEANTIQVVTTALDCIGKLISYSYFSYPSEQPAGSPEQPALIDRAIDTICDCFQMDATHADIELQILKSLLSAILNDKIVVHGAGLLKAVRQTYNVFLHSKSSNNQQVAQGALTQMVGTVFERVKSRLRVKEARINLSKSSLHKNNSGDVSPEGGDIGGVDANGDDAETSENASDLPVEKDDGAKITLQSFENRKSFDDARIADNAPTLVTRNKPRRTPSRANTLQSNDGQESTDPTEEEEEDEIYVKDAYLVFRAMCRLSTKSVPLEEAQNVRSQSMRSKLLSLHIIHTILHNNVAVFVSPYATIRSSNTAEPTTFVQAIKQYLCLSLSRNGASSLKQVFEISCEIFWLMLHQLRVMLKKEIEVFMKEIYLAVLEKRSAPAFQKQYILQILHRLGGDPRALVEIYLNYDCDRSALDNHFQKIVEHLARICSTPVAITPQQQLAYQEHHAKHQAASPTDWQSRAMLPPSLATLSLQPGNEMDHGFPPEYSLKQESLEALVEILRSLVNWSQQSISDAAAALRANDGRPSHEDLRESLDTRANLTASPALDSPNGPGTPAPEDDPSQLERAKQRKTALNHAIRQFNYKPKKGMKLLISDGFIPSNSPEDVARFLLSNEQIHKNALGEYLGEGDEENVKIMHAFVDLMDFAKTRFVDALRRFLQSFRLPGEAQKIDRFMLKFAERYMTGNPSAFANADTAYVLAYSVIMLNTDQHSSKMKGPRMTPEDFIKNNRGINDNADLPDEYLKGIYDEIASNEIVLDTERETAANLGQLPQANQGGGLGNIGQAFANVGRDLQREAYIQASEQMANRTEQLYKSLLRAQRRGPTRFPVSKFIPASSFKHVGPMFEVTWMPFLTALSGPAQDTHNLETIKLCMEGQKLAIRIACLFDLEDPRQAFVTSLSRFTNLYNLTEMKAKNIEALYALLEVAQHEGNLLKESWREILTCISQLDRFQLISAGIEDTAVPDLMRSNSASSRTSTTPSRKSLQAPNKSRPRSGTAALYHSEAAVESRSADMVRAVDRIFTNTANLSGEAIVQFVRALTQVSWQEIQSSGQSESPRTYSLQKLVEISSYNMNRVRFEWTNIWQILGEHFNQVGCHTNTNVVFFALNSLRQLSMKFLEIGELPGFKFQKDFLKPFEHIMKNTGVVPVKDMVLRCLIQMIQARGENIRSGWRTMFGVFTVAAKEPYEGIVNLAFDNITQIYNTRFGVVISQGAFADLIVCLTEFSKNHKFQRKSLQAIETLKSTVPKMLRTPECPLSIGSDKPKDEPQATGVPKQPTRQTQEEQFWFPVLFAYHDVLMTGEDLEVRSRALTYLFDTLQQYGAAFPRDFWDTLWRQILYPIFMVLRSKSEMSNALNHEELTVWLSTTFIQALRHMIALFTHFFGALEYMLDRFLELLALCICQENDTLARIGSNCLQQLVHQNVTKFSEGHWEKIVSAFVDLFHRTEATALFSAATAGSYTPTINGSKASRAMSDTASMSDLPLDSDDRSDIEDPNALGINGLMSPRRGSAAVSDDGTNGSPRTDLEDYKPLEGIQQAPVVVTAARRRFFNQIITKCVLQLLMIETVNELFSNDDVYAQIPSPQLLRLMTLLKKSYQFAKRFNEDRELRTKLFREGFMKQPPNLLKQESGSAAVYVSILFRMYHDTSSERRLNRANTEQALIPLCVDIVTSYIHLDEETQQRNIVTWRPVVIDVLDGYAGFPEQDFDKHVKVFAPLVVGLMNREMGLELQRSVQGLLQRILEVKVGIEAGGLVVERGSPLGERRPSVFGRRGSKASK